MTTQTHQPGYESRTINEWIALAKKRPVPKLLFGEFWVEGELAVLFGDTGVGKSLLAVQIAESIARGQAIYPFDMDAKPQRVLYFDFDLTEKQLEMRYAKDHKPQQDSLKCHYRFSERFHRATVDPNEPLPDGFRNFDEYLIGVIKERLRETGAKVLIIDNILHLKRSYGSSADAVRLMNTLNSLKKQFGLSILLLAHSRKRAWSRTLTAGDQVSAKILANLADSVFAIGQAEGSPEGRYLKHLKTRSTEMIYDASNVPLFCVRKLADNFLGFSFLWFDPERTHRFEARHPRESEMMDKIVEMSDRGMTIREIGTALDMPKSTVHRLLRMWKPPEDDVAKTVYDESTYASDEGDPPDYDDDDWEPPEEEYPGQHTDWYLQNKGIRPVWREKWEAEQKRSDDGANFPVDDNDVDTLENQYEEDEYEPVTADTGPFVRLDGYGREILVESEDTDGRPMVWYQLDPKGVKHRYERRGFVVLREAAPT